MVPNSIKRLFFFCKKSLLAPFSTPETCAGVPEWLWKPQKSKDHKILHRSCMPKNFPDPKKNKKNRCRKKKFGFFRDFLKIFEIFEISPKLIFFTKISIFQKIVFSQIFWFFFSTSIFFRSWEKIWGIAPMQNFWDLSIGET